MKLMGLLLLLMVLCGCTAQPRQEATTLPPQTTVEAELPTEPTGCYVPDVTLEQASGGALRRYRVQLEDVNGMMTMGSDVLIFSGTQTTTLTRLAGDNLFTVAQTTLTCLVSPEDSSFRISDNGITYFDPQCREIIFLDNDLKEVSRLAMPEDMVGKPVLSSSRMKVYYCTPDAVRVYELETGLNKLLKAIAYPHQTVEDVLAGDSVLRCGLTDENGGRLSVFLSTQTGELIAQTDPLLTVRTGQNSYFAQMQEGPADLLLYAYNGGTPGVLSPADMFAQAFYLHREDGVMTVGYRDGNTVLERYDLESGLRLAWATLPGQIIPWCADAAQNGPVYLLGEEQGEAVLLRWDSADSPVADETVYTGPRYTLKNPDAQGLEQCRAYAETLGQKYGIQIMTGPEAAEAQPWDYVLEPEYQVRVLNWQLSRLEACLANFPEDFFRKIPAEMTISLVRAIRGNAQSGNLQSVDGLQFWADERGCVALTAGEALEYQVYHQLFHMMDGKILSDTRAYYYWHNLNPQGFAYYEDETTYLTRDNSAYLQDGDRAFIDAYSMCYAKEDRATIMAYACNPGNEAYFQSEIMQKKLHTLCKGIREAFDLQKYPQPLLWEQYLKTPMVP